MIASGDADGFASRIGDGFDVAGFVESKQIAVDATGSHPISRRNATTGNFDHVNRIDWPSNADDGPLITSRRLVFPIQNLRRAVWLGLQNLVRSCADVGKLVPSFGDVDPSGNNAIEYHAAHCIRSDRFNRDTDPSGMFVFSWFDRLNRGIANEPSQFDGARERVCEW